MKIAIVSPAYPLRGGIAEFAGAMATDLTQRRHDVHLVSFKRQYPSLLFPGKTQYEDEAAGQEHLEAHHIIDSINPLSWLQAGTEIASMRADLVIFNFWMPFFGPALGTIARRVRKRSDARIVFVCHNIIPHERRPGDRALTRYALKVADHCIVLSSPVGNDLETILPQMPYTVVPHPVYDTYGNALPKSEAREILGISEDNLVLFFGFVRKYKGLDILIQALPEILDSCRVKLLVVGEFYDDEEKYRAMVARLGLEGQVRFVPEFVPRGKVGTYFSAADVVALPYRSATQSGIVQIANHFDTPCIVTDVGGLSEIVDHGRTGFVIPPEDPGSLATAVIKFFTETDRESMKRSIAEDSDRYSWSSLSAVLEECGSRVLR